MAGAAFPWCGTPPYNNNMKHSAILLITSLVWLMASSCSKTDTPSEIDITGSWTMTAQSHDEGKTWTAWTLVPTVAVFNADGRFYTDGCLGEYNGRWTRKGNLITATATEGEQIIFRIVSADGGTAVMRITSLYGAIWVRAEKQ